MDLQILLRVLKRCFSFNLRALLAVYLMVVSPLVLAQAPRAISLGIFDLTPSLLVEYAEDDNLYLSAETPLSTSITTLTPAFELLFDNGVSGFSLLYTLEDATFSDRESENYTDQRALLNLGSMLTDIHRLEASFLYADDHDRRGPDAPSGIADDLTVNLGSLDEYEDTEYELRYTFGNEDSLRTLEINGEKLERTYTTNLESTEEFNREESTVGVVAGFNISPDLLINLAYTDTEISYVNNSSRDGDEQTYSVGVNWSPIESTRLEADVGVTKRLSLGSDEEISNDYWLISLNWDIYSYSTLNFLSSSAVEEVTSRDGEYVLLEEFGFSWNHQWTDLLETEFSYTKGSLDFIGGERLDDFNTTTFRLGYDFRPWVNLGFFFERRERDVKSIISVAEDYDQQVIGINAFFQLL